MEESIDFDMRYTQDALSPSIPSDELALLESMLPDLIHAMMALEVAEAE